MRRVPFDQRLWRPENYLGPEGREDRERVLLSLAQRTPEALPLDYGAEEFRPGYLERVRARISPPAQPGDVAAAKGQLYRIVGERK